MAKRRPLQVGSTIQREMQNRLARGLADPRIKGLITITRVEMTDDLSLAKVFVTVMPESDENITMHGLRAATKKLRHDVSSRMRIKEMPQIKFVVDTGLQEQKKIMELINRDRLERESRGIVDSQDAIQDAQPTEPTLEDGLL